MEFFFLVLFRPFSYMPMIFFGPVLSYFLLDRIHCQAMLDMGPIITCLQPNGFYVLSHRQCDSYSSALTLV